MVRPLERAVLAALMVGLAGFMALAGQGTSRADHFSCHSPNRGWGFDTYEYEDYAGRYNAAIDLAVRGWAVPPPYTLGDGERIDVSYQGVESGPRGARLPASTANGIPPTIYKSIAWVESGWSHAANQVPYGGVGPVITAIDCGYGLGQITTGMGHLAAPPALDVRVPAARQAIIGTHPLFNIAEGVRILADKWNAAPNFRPIAGTGDPAAIEDWYYAIWSYNGFAFVNHPLNPSKDPLRGSVWHCSDPNAPGYGFFEWGDYTYQEKVYGCMRYPPVPKGGTYPPPLGGTTTTPPAGSSAIAVGDTVVVFGTGNGLNIREAAGTGAPVATIVPDGTQLTVVGGPATANGLTWWNVQHGGITGWAAAQYLRKPAPEPPPDAPVNPAGRIWKPQIFTMPNLSSPEIATALASQVYLACEDNDFAGGCPGMDFPTIPHYDTTPPANPADAALFIGDPVMQIDGARQVTITATATTATSSPVTVRNTGTGILPFRVRTSADWVIVRHPTDPPARVVDGGVAVGPDMEVVAQASPRAATKGKESVLQITVDPRFLAAGTHTATVVIDALLGTGAPVTFTVTVTSPGGSGGGPVTPTPTPQGPVPRAYLPGVHFEGSH